MKVRNGFVSNSSSASYIVQFGVSFSRLAELLIAEYGYEIMNIADMVAERLKFMRGEQDQKQKPDYIALLKFVERNEDYTYELLEKLKRATTDEEKLRLSMDAAGIQILELDDTVTLTNHTTMHNDFKEGICEMLQEIILYMIFEHPDVKITTKIDHYS